MTLYELCGLTSDEPDCTVPATGGGLQAPSARHKPAALASTRVFIEFMVSTPATVDRPARAGGAGVWRTICLVPVIDENKVGHLAAIDYSESMQFAFAANG